MNSDLATSSTPPLRRAITRSPRPSRGWYLLCLIWPAIGCAVAIYFGVQGFTEEVGGMSRWEVPGRAYVELEPGRYELFHEYRSDVGGRVYATPKSTLPRCTVGPAESDGEGARLNVPERWGSYELPGYQGQSLYELEVFRQGTYLIRCRARARTVVALSASDLGNSLEIAFASVLSSGLLGLLAFLMLARRRGH